MSTAEIARLLADIAAKVIRANEMVNDGAYDEASYLLGDVEADILADIAALRGAK